MNLGVRTFFQSLPSDEVSRLSHHVADVSFWRRLVACVLLPTMWVTLWFLSDELVATVATGWPPVIYDGPTRGKFIAFICSVVFGLPFTIWLWIRILQILHLLTDESIVWILVSGQFSARTGFRGFLESFLILVAMCGGPALVSLLMILYLPARES